MGSMILFDEISDQKVFASMESTVHSYLYGLYMITYMQSQIHICNHVSSMLFVANYFNSYMD